MEVDLSGVADRQIVTLTIRNVIDEFGQTLPETNLQIGFLQGDVNGDGTVNAGDALLTRSRSGQSVSETNYRTDINLDGVINTGDAQIVRSKSGSALPLPLPQ